MLLGNDGESFGLYDLKECSFGADDLDATRVPSGGFFSELNDLWILKTSVLEHSRNVWVNGPDHVY